MKDPGEKRANLTNPMPVCQNCKKEFVIEPEDFLFYKKVSAPTPTFCPYCRLMRRMSFFNLSKFYKRNCDACGKNTITIHAPDKPYKMYCNQCWWRDNWDGTEYGIGYDSSRPFFDQLIELRNKSIFMALETLYPSLTKTEYTNNSSYQKECFMTMCADFDEHCAYTTISAHSKDCLDCYRVRESEKCYECTGVFKSFNCLWCEEIDSCVDSLFCQSCYGCINCLGCVNLHDKTHHIFNVKYSKEEYFEKIKEYKLDTYDGRQKMKKMAEIFWAKAPKRAYHGNSMNTSTSGEYIYESKNTHNAYLVSGAEDCRYVQYLTLKTSKNCYDYTGWGAGSELLYECFIVGEGGYNVKFSAECWPHARDVEYSFYCIQGKDCFGCVNLKRKSYCILNKQYTKEEYQALKEKIIADMKVKPWKSKAGHLYTYGEFLPPALSPFGYNETVAQEYSPLSPDEAERKGYNWYQFIKPEYKTTCSSQSLAKTFEKTPETIIEEIIQCENCEKAYNISVIEMGLLKKFNQPIPHMCPSCRHLRRFNRTNKLGIHERNCGKCGADIKTPYSITQPEVIYCEKCYQQEVV